MPDQGRQVLYKSALNAMKSLQKIQQEKNKMTMGMLEQDIKTGGSLMSKMLESRMPQRPKAPLGPEESRLKTAQAEWYERRPTTQEKVPSWKQQQYVNSIKSGITKGKVVLGYTSFGMPIERDVTNRAEAEEAISFAKLDPSLFEDELKALDEPQGGVEDTGDIEAQKQQARDAGYTDKEINAFLGITE